MNADAEASLWRRSVIISCFAHSGNRPMRFEEQEEQTMFHTAIIPSSSLEKPFLTRPITRRDHGEMFKNELFSCQFAFSAVPQGRPEGGNFVKATFKIDSPLKARLKLGLVGQVGVTMPTYLRYDQDYLGTEPGLYPDPILPLEEGEIHIYLNKWRSIWVTVQGGDDLQAGEYPIMLTLYDGAGGMMAQETFSLRVIGASLPPQTLPCTNWLHFDAIADQHYVPMFSEAFWALLERYVAMAVAGGTNLLLTPCFTPPLDTPVGEERMTAQLVDVRLEKSVYSFDFSKLERYIALAQRCGEVYFEHSHLYSQWGASHAPKIMACVDGEVKRLFGWETDSQGTEYTRFLEAYLSALTAFLKERRLTDRFYFHVSDEPLPKHMPCYMGGHRVLSRFVDPAHIIDALSHVEFLEKGAIQAPVAVTTSVPDFLGKTDHLWAYYTGGQSFSGLTNRLISMPQRRNRVLGLQLYALKIEGFLHWAFNFYYNQLSRKPVNPFLSPDALGDFVGGTSYLVYPGEDGPLPSLRYYASAEAMNDWRALKLLESLAGREAAMKLLTDCLGDVGFDSCPASDACYLELREAINRAIEERL